MRKIHQKTPDSEGTKPLLGGTGRLEYSVKLIRTTWCAYMEKNTQLNIKLMTKSSTE